GNVHPFASFDDLCYADFVRAAKATAEHLSRCVERNSRVGSAILEVVHATTDVAKSNVNLGIVLLLAPMALVPANQHLIDGIERVLASTTVLDTEQVYEAIRLARPGGLGTSAAQDVRERPTQTLVDVMRLASHRDRIAEQYATNFQFALTDCRKWLVESWERFHVTSRAVETELSQECRTNVPIAHERLGRLPGHDLLGPFDCSSEQFQLPDSNCLPPPRGESQGGGQNHGRDFNNSAYSSPTLPIRKREYEKNSVMENGQSHPPAWEIAILSLQLQILASGIDTLIARKCGETLAKDVSNRADQILQSGWPDTAASWILWRQFDDYLRSDGHRLNPGTTADLIVATLFAAFRDRQIAPPSKIEL
ncbi:MAG: hypothetical protein FJ267_11650, partial [Planctomycetes bacterium]|nr:hypothetical protein [Planctomycetota bacterium]